MQNTKSHGPQAAHDDGRSVHVDTCGFDAKEMLVLELMRYFCLSYAEPITQGWLSAFSRAQGVLGQEEGAVLACHVSDLLSAVRRERKTQFNFVDPRCEHCVVRVFPTELALILLLRSARAANGDTMQSIARELVGDAEISETMGNGRALAGCLHRVSLGAPGVWHAPASNRIH